MIKKSSYNSKLWSKETISFEIDTLKDLRELKNKYKAVTMYYFNDSCSSFRTLKEIKGDCNKYNLVDSEGKPINSFKWHFGKGHIIKLANPYIFRVDTLRGYPNTYIIEWLTKKYRVSVKTKTNLWQDVTIKHEKDTNSYADNTIKPVKLIPVYPESLTGELNFNVINWSGGNMTTYNNIFDKVTMKTFNTNLFHGKRLFNEVV